ncbi:hypothetical protein CC2G_002268 [Coprinopsis cinerea AmutBmut pab1-1]|nr:hypothetical protein CC2G_002268 [Coprinopsis cinerea AmutBmut pab1-1]
MKRADYTRITGLVFLLKIAYQNAYDLWALRVRASSTRFTKSHRTIPMSGTYSTLPVISHVFRSEGQTAFPSQ